jgi:riboflavin synthase alpha subunit
MTGLKSKLLKIALGTSVAILCLSVSEQASLTHGGTFMTSAEALIGAPLTPLSYADVARRTTRRAIVGGAVVGGAIVGGAIAGAAVVAVPPSCVQAVDVYGRIYNRCY